MRIDLVEILISDVANCYEDSAENGVIGYGGKLNIRPAYQREFIYKDKQRDEVINTIRNGFPLNVMYWVLNEQGTYEMLDGQQRTISFCSYINGDYSINFQYFHNLTEDEKKQILDYKVMIYICEGTDKEILDWFKIINIAGEKLTNQELRNAIYTGEWLTDAKKYFSKNGCPAYMIASDYVSGASIRQEYLETVIRWISSHSKKTIEDYMSEHQHDTNANELWLYFQSVISWVKATFPNYRREMKGIEWGIYYNQYSKHPLDPKTLGIQVDQLMEDEDITKKAGVYEYLLDGEERHLNLRAFSDKIKRETFEKQKGKCPHCKKQFQINEMEADHITPWHEGGKTLPNNCQMLCKGCNRIKSGK